VVSGSEAPASLREAVARLGQRLGDVSQRAVGQTIEYRRHDQLFAVLDEDALELRLHPEVADAARRTPATGASGRGAEWVRFSPPALDRHALDRVEAWFTSAWRAAGTKGG
jgi:hypothetical protein